MEIKTGKVVLVEPGKEARIAEMVLSLENMEKTVGGLIETVYPWDDDTVLVCNENGKLEGLPPNRALYGYDLPVDSGIKGDKTNDPWDIIAGTFFVCRHGERDLEGLTDEQAQKYYNRFKDIEIFITMEDNS